MRIFTKLDKGDGSDKAKADLLREICLELTIHAQAEEEVFYPAVRATIKDDDLMDEAHMEHAGVKSRIAGQGQESPIALSVANRAFCLGYPAAS